MATHTNQCLPSPASDLSHHVIVCSVLAHHASLLHAAACRQKQQLSLFPPTMCGTHNCQSFGSDNYCSVTRRTAEKEKPLAIYSSRDMYRLDLTVCCTFSFYPFPFLSLLFSLNHCYNKAGDGKISSPRCYKAEMCAKGWDDKAQLVPAHISQSGVKCVTFLSQD